jgi:hypothetical protein
LSSYRLRPKGIADLEAIGDFIAAADPGQALFIALSAYDPLRLNMEDAPKPYCR